MNYPTEMQRKMDHAAAKARLAQICDNAERQTKTPWLIEFIKSMRRWNEGIGGA